jgi:ABC-type multidrug transport system fused ATPase/permease subunit
MGKTPKHARREAPPAPTAAGSPEGDGSPGTDGAPAAGRAAKLAEVDPEHRRQLSARAVLRTHLRVIGPDRPKLYLAAALATIVGVLEAAMLFLLARVAMAVATDEAIVELAPGSLGPVELTRSEVLVVLLVVLIALMVVVTPLAWTQAQLSSSVAKRLRMDLLRSYLRADWAYRSSLREGRLAQLAGEFAQRAEHAVGSLVAGIAGMIIVLIPLLLLLVAEPVMTAATFAGLAAIAVVLRPFASRHKRNAVVNAHTMQELVTRVSQTDRLSGEITAFNVDEPVSASLEREVDASARSIRTLRFVARAVPALFQYIALTAVVVMMAVLLSVGSAAIDDVAPLVLVLVRALTYLRQVIQSLQTSVELTPFVTTLEAAIAENTSHPRLHGRERPLTLPGIELVGVEYAYGSGRPVLHDVDFTLGVGEIVGVVGPSGAGKSTLSHLLLGLRQPTAGKVFVGQVELREIDPAWWAERIGYVPQDNQLIYGTVAENIAFYREGMGRDEVERAARSAHLDQEIEALPDGYDTLLGPGARDLSGGQRQRLGIARALASSPRIIVMDEPTSALDARSEVLIRTTLEEVRESAAVVLVAHRPATLEICDRVLRVEDGRVEEISPPGRGDLAGPAPNLTGRGR